MHTVCELKTFGRAAKAAGMTEDEVDELLEFLSLNPMAGEEIEGTGGCRKVRVAGRGKGKSGGYRTITFYSGQDVPVFLITVFSKGERSDLSKADRNELAALTKELVSECRKKVVKIKKIKRRAT
jgi:hypothetical protein